MLGSLNGRTQPLYENRLVRKSTRVLRTHLWGHVGTKLNCGFESRGVVCYNGFNSIARALCGTIILNWLSKKQ